MSLSPSLDDLFLNAAMLRDPRVQMLDAEAFRALMMLVSTYSTTLVWTYTEPSTQGLPDDNERLARIVGLTKEAWLACRPQVQPFFGLREGRWLLSEDWIRLSPQFGTKRPAISADARLAVLRKSEFRCGYCGTAAGPFEVDHIIPVSQGGSNDHTNLIAACWVCNRAKGGRTPGEWLS